ncbi:hypothetical protein NTHI1209_00100 [Haemophilus influenzae]|uniref:Uncharacterized protein n=1 Tax=Haemophilus influenzae TaxID=727 RepID=A0A158T0P1_HAEIF|nr:hypothetical protein NTHI1209_00100 [Haemophilus influenzae]
MPAFKIGLSVNPLFLLKYVYIFKFKGKNYVIYPVHFSKRKDCQKPYLQIGNERTTCPKRPAV